jgi:hypothetical protein
MGSGMAWARERVSKAEGKDLRWEAAEPTPESAWGQLQGLESTILRWLEAEREKGWAEVFLGEGAVRWAVLGGPPPATRYRHLGR